jgi:hypothetical protein
VEKIEPQAVVEQSVTNFPVLVSLANEGPAAAPGHERRGVADRGPSQRRDRRARRCRAQPARGARDRAVARPRRRLGPRPSHALDPRAGGRGRAARDSASTAVARRAWARGRRHRDGRALAGARRPGFQRRRSWAAPLGRSRRPWAARGAPGGDASAAAMPAAGARANRAQVVFVRTASGRRAAAREVGPERFRLVGGDLGRPRGGRGRDARHHPGASLAQPAPGPDPPARGLDAGRHRRRRGRRRGWRWWRLAVVVAAVGGGS